MENPFVKLVKEGEESSREQESLVEFSSEDGNLTWRRRKGDAPWNTERDVRMGTLEARERMEEIEAKVAGEDK